MNPPRPTPAKLRALDKKLERVVNDINMMTQGNTMSSDSIKLEKLRSVRARISDARVLLSMMLDSQHRAEERA